MRNVTRWSLLSGSVSLVIFLSGCGSGTPEVTTSREDSGDAASSGVPSAPAQPAAMPGATPAANPDAAGMANTTPMTPDATPGVGIPTANTPAYNPGDTAATGIDSQTKPASKFPADVTEWTPDDFRKAAQAGDKNLPKAIEHLVSDKPGDAEVAALLAEMLELVGKSKSGTVGTPGTETPGTAAPNDSAAPNGSAGLRTPEATTKTVKAAFPPPAAGTTTLGNPTTGRIGAPMTPGFGGVGFGQGGMNTRDLVRVIVDGLARNGSNEAWLTLTNVLAGEIKTSVNDDMMTEWVLTAALDNYGGESHPTHQLLQAAVQSPEDLNPRRGTEIKRKVTDLLLSTAASVMDQLMGIPIDDPSNKSAFGGRGINGQAIDPATMAAGTGIAAGNPAITGSQGFNSGQQPIGTSQLKIKTRPLDDDAVSRAARFLWRPEMISYVEKETRSLTAFEDDVELLAIAGSMPMTEVRKSTFELLESHWKSGAEPLLRQELYQSIARDPGLIVVLKLLPRAVPKGSGRSPNQRASKSYRENQAKISWMRTSANMVLAVTKRLHAASQRAGHPDLDPSDLPFKLHKDARIRSTYQLNWPADVSDRVSDATAPGQTLVQYVRMEVDAEIAAKTFQFYKRQLKRSKDYSSPQGKWLDSLTTGSEPGTRRSIDIIVRKAAANSGVNGQQNRGNVGTTGTPTAGTGFGGSLPRSTNSGNSTYGTGGAGQQSNTNRYTIDVLVVEIPNPKLTSGK